MRHFPYPEPRPHLNVPSGGIPEGADPRRYWDHSTWAVRWMGRNTLRHLHELYKAGEPFPATGDLASWILEMTERQAPQHFEYVPPNVAERQAAAAAAWALEAYDSNALVYQRAARGGAKSKRRSPHLDRLRELSHLKPGAAAQELGVKPEQVRRLRKQLDRLDFEAELRELFGY